MSLTSIYFTRLIFVTVIHYPRYNISPSDSLPRCEAKSLDHKIQVTDLHILDKVNLCVTLSHYTNYDVHPSNNLEDSKQNH